MTDRDKVNRLLAQFHELPLTLIEELGDVARERLMLEMQLELERNAERARLHARQEDR